MGESTFRANSPKISSTKAITLFEPAPERYGKIAKRGKNAEGKKKEDRKRLYAAVKVHYGSPSPLHFCRRPPPA